MNRAESIAAAVADVTSGKLSVRQAAEKYAISKSTLYNRTQNGNKNKCTSHEKQMSLTLYEEQLIVDWIWIEDSLGRAPTHQDIKELAEDLLAQRGKPTELGKKWVGRFIARHEEIKAMKGKKLATERRKGTTYDKVVEFFDAYESIIAKYNITGANIYNMDETGFLIGVTSNQLVVAPSFKRKTFVQSPETRQRTTAVECISALGVVIKPLIIFKGASLWSHLTPPNPPEWHYDSNSSAWITNDLAIKWLLNTFLPNTKPANEGDWRLIIMDNHQSHCTGKFMTTCLKNKVAVIYLPAHSSHALQPLDVSCFSPVKTKYTSLLQRLSRYQLTDKVRCHNFIENYKIAREVGLSTRNIKTGFKTAGLWPINRQKILESSLVTESPQAKQLKRPRPQDDSEISPGPSAKRLHEIQGLEKLDTSTSRELSAVMRGKDKEVMSRDLEIILLRRQLKGSQAQAAANANRGRRTRVNQSSNEAFATAADFHEAQERQRARESRKTRASRAHRDTAGD